MKILLQDTKKKTAVVEINDEYFQYLIGCKYSS